MHINRRRARNVRSVLTGRCWQDSLSGTEPKEAAIRADVVQDIPVRQLELGLTSVLASLRNRRGRPYSTDPNCAVRPKSPNSRIRSSDFAVKQRYVSHMNRSSTAGLKT